MAYAKSRCEHYLQLEDNIEAVAAYDRVIFGYITMKQGKDWFVMDFADMGITGTLFSADSLNYMTTALAMYYRFKPVEWILKDILRNQYCNPEMGDKACAQVQFKQKIENWNQSGLMHILDHLVALHFIWIVTIPASRRDLFFEE
ncbi:unnamed protein product [Cylicostephanus goldi]|uniref:MGAT4 conserved region domain-containing protein n=1 Tax=Cylicostephanus goldi TaxID=71465 RepID=A0A3P6UCA9_CYLGO|nr:unnamed protein product [Cylicostephanus goldi]